MSLKDVWIKVTLETKAIRWKRGKSTTVILYPNEPNNTGRWDTDPSDDLDDMGRDTTAKMTSDPDKPESMEQYALYYWNRKEDTLHLQLTHRKGWNYKNFLTLEGFLDTVGSVGSGGFDFKGKLYQVRWSILGHPDLKVSKIQPIKEKTILDRPYRIEGDLQALHESKLDFQTYEYYNEKQELLYVGKAGGEQIPRNWEDRLKESHIKTQWIGEAKTIYVTYGITRCEAFALEQVLIKTQRPLYNVAEGEHWKRCPEGATSIDALNAQRHGKREPFVLVLYETNQRWSNKSAD